MPSAKAAKAADAPDVVLVPFAYAAARDGQVVQLVRGDPVDPKRFVEKSLEHLRSIGFIGPQN